VLVVPDLEAGNMLAKSRADGLLTRLASCAVAVLVAPSRRASTAAAMS
jgi:phosphotransacetylase